MGKRRRTESTADTDDAAAIKTVKLGFIPATAAESLKKILAEEKYCDVTFEVGSGKERIKCHRVFLKERSPVFEVMFSEPWDQNEETIQVPDGEPTAFRLFLQFIYTDDYQSENTTEIVNVLHLAHKYDVQPLVQHCQSLLKISFSKTPFFVFQVARRYGLAELEEVIGNYIATNFVLCIEELRDKNVEMGDEGLTYVLKRDDLRMDECNLFEWLIRIFNDRSEDNEGDVATAMQKFLPYIRFPTMTLQEFTTRVVSKKILSDKDAVDIFSYFGGDEESRAAAATTLPYSVIPRRCEESVEFYKICKPVILEKCVVKGPGSLFGDSVSFEVYREDVGWPYAGMVGCRDKDVALQGVYLACPKIFRGNGLLRGSLNCEMTIKLKNTEGEDLRRKYRGINLDIGSSTYVQIDPKIVMPWFGTEISIRLNVLDPLTSLEDKQSHYYFQSREIFKCVRELDICYKCLLVEGVSQDPEKKSIGINLIRGVKIGVF